MEDKKENIVVDTDNSKEKVDKKKKNIKKINIVIIILFFILLIISIVAYVLNNKKDDNKEVKVDDVPYTANKYKMSGNGLEDFDLYFLKLNDDSKTNSVYSPLSIKYALSMLNEGTEGDSHKQIEGLIGDYKSTKYNNSKNMSIANAFFVRDTYKEQVNTDYINTIAKKYNADVIFDSFGNPNKINEWVKNNTFNQIDNYLDDISEDDFILVNALAIDMEWVNKIQDLYDDYIAEYSHEDYELFVASLADFGYYEDTFNNSSYNDYKYASFAASANKYDIIKTIGEDNIRKKVADEYEKFVEEDVCGLDNYESTESVVNNYISDISKNYGQLSSSTDFSFYESDDISVFAKDLKEYDGTTLQYIAVMPKNDSLSDYIKNVDADKLTNIIDNIKSIDLNSFEDGYVTKLEGHVPMFSYSKEIDLKDNLIKFGVTDVFDSEKANLGNLTTSKSYISDAKHKTQIDFSNDGIKASAVTTLGGKGSISCDFDYKYEVPVKTIDLNFNKPFIYMVRDKNSGEVWFMGSVYEPIRYSLTSDGMN